MCAVLLCPLTLWLWQHNIIVSWCPLRFLLCVVCLMQKWRCLCLCLSGWLVFFCLFSVHRVFLAPTYELRILVVALVRAVSTSSFFGACRTYVRTVSTLSFSFARIRRFKDPTNWRNWIWPIMFKQLKIFAFVYLRDSQNLRIRIFKGFSPIFVFVRYLIASKRCRIHRLSGSSISVDG